MRRSTSSVPRRSLLPKKVSVRRLFGLVTPYKGAFAVGLVMLALGSCVNLLLPEIGRRLLEEPLRSTVLRHPFSIAGFLIALFAFQGVCFYCRSYLFGAVSRRVVRDVRERFFEAVLYQPIDPARQEKSGELASRLNADAALLQDAVGIKLSMVIRYGFQVLVSVVLMAFLSLRMTATVAVSVTLIVGVSALFIRRLRASARDEQAALADATSLAGESFEGTRVIRSLGAEPYVSDRFFSSLQTVVTTGLTRIKVGAGFSSFVSFLNNACIVLGVSYGIHLVGGGELTMSELAAFVIYGTIVTVSFALLATGYTDLVQSLGGMERLFETIDQAPARRSGGNLLRRTESRGVALRVENLSYSYTSREGSTVLSAISFSVDPGRTVALVGPSGSGKSTFVSLVLGFYPPDAGFITYDDRPISDIDPAELRSLIAWAPQDPLLFSTSVSDNLRLAAPDADEARIKEALRAVGLLDLVQSLPQGLETPLGERGTQLSGGQRQRIALARILLRNPAFVILDEATSALDSESEERVQRALKEALPQATFLVISHRLSTIRDADSVLVLDGGRIAQQGTHESLKGSEGLYQQYVQLQALG